MLFVPEGEYVTGHRGNSHDRGGQTPSPVFLPVASHLRSLMGATQEPGKLTFRTQLAGDYLQVYMARRMDRKEVQVIDTVNRGGWGMMGGPATRRGATTTMSWHRR